MELKEIANFPADVPVNTLFFVRGEDSPLDEDCWYARVAEDGFIVFDGVPGTGEPMAAECFEEVGRFYIPA